MIMANIYQQDGFLNYRKCEALSSTLNVMIGPRNAGKTFGALLHYTRCRAPFVFMRTTKAQVELVFSEDFSPFNKLNKFEGSRYCAEKIPKSQLIGVYDDFTYEDGKKVITGKRCGYCLALSQIGATRGFDLDDVEVILYDEFVKHPGEVIQGSEKQFSKYADIVFTINRDREIAGRPAIKQWLFGNSDDLSNNIICSLNLVEYIIRMKQAGENYLKLKDRDISIFLLDDSPVAKVLAEKSGLSKVFAGTEYLDMAFSNEFVYDDYSDCMPVDLHPYVPVMKYGNICIYRHKRKDGFYVRQVKKDAVFAGIPSYQPDEKGTINAREEHAGLYYSWLAGIMIFDSYDTKLKFMKLYNIK